MPEQTKTTFKREEIEKAVAIVLGEQVNDAMIQSLVGLWSRHMSACLRCFEQDRRDESAELLRSSWKKLGEKGSYDY